MPREVPTCGSGKKSYRSPEAALNAAKKEAARYLEFHGLPPGTRPASVAWYSYPCDRDGCDAYHRTKNPPRKPPGTSTLKLPEVPLSQRRRDSKLDDLGVLEAAVADAIRKQGPGLLYPGRDVVSKQYELEIHIASALRKRLVDAGLLVFRLTEGPRGTFRTTRPPVSLFD